MNRKPRGKNDGIFSGGLGVDVAYQGFLVALLTVISYYIGEHIHPGDGMTSAFFTMAMCEVFHSFNMRSQRQSAVGMLFKNHHNWALYAAMLGSFLLTTAVVEVDVLSNLFGFTHLGIQQYLISLALAFSIIPLVEIVKYFQRKFCTSHS